VLCSNLLPLRDFFLSGMYKDDINTDNPMGAGGKVAVAYARLLKEIWYDGWAPLWAPLFYMRAKVFQLANEYSTTANWRVFFALGVVLWCVVSFQRIFDNIFNKL
jgi:hypothetical protein